FRTTGQNSHRGNVRLIWERPEQSSFTFSTDARFGGNSGFGENTSQTLSGDGVLQNSQERTNSTEGQSHSVDSRATYRQLFAKPGRLLTLEGRGNWSAQRSDMMLLANSRFANDPQGETFTTELLDQRQDEDQDNLGYSAAAIYTEPLGRGRYLETAYRRGSSTETYAKDFYDREDGSEVLNTELSNAFTKRYTTDRLGVSLRINQNDYGLTAGVDFLNSQLSAVLASDVPLNRNFMNFLPRLSAEYEFTTTKSINFEYSTTLNEPTLQQLQPVLNNANPLVTVTGNPDLVPEYRHSAQLGYHSFSQLNFRSLFSMVNVVYTRNKITNTQTIDSQFRQVITPENTGDALMGMGYLGGSILIKPIKTSLRMNGTYVYNQQQQWVNGVENQTQRKTTQLQVSLDNKKKEVLDWTVGTRFNVTDVRYSELISLNQQYSQLTYYTILRIPLGPRLKVNTTFDYQQYFGEQFGGTQTVPLWSASISRTFGPTERLEVKATAFDLLNQNVGISRNASLNFIEDVQYNALSRYFLLTATWSLNKFGPQKSFFTISGQGI
ncbi:MAG: outer membrane beta-barrel protein, partial [Bacteroidota bacterium]